MPDLFYINLTNPQYNSNYHYYCYSVIIYRLNKSEILKSKILGEDKIRNFGDFGAVVSEEILEKSKIIYEAKEIKGYIPAMETIVSFLKNICNEDSQIISKQGMIAQLVVWKLTQKENNE